MGSIETREKIKQTSIKLFNEYRATNISKMQIAKAAGMSTGNMYYYFRSKEEVIRCIWEEDMKGELENVLNLPEFGKSENGIIQGCYALHDLVQKYIFFFSELPALMFNDEELKKLYGEFCDYAVARLVEIMKMWQEIGIMLPTDEAGNPFLAETLWHLAQTLLPYQFLLKEEDDPKRAGFQRVYSFLRPYFAYSTNERIRRLLLIEEAD